MGRQKVCFYSKAPLLKQIRSRLSILWHVSLSLSSDTMFCAVYRTREKLAYDFNFKHVSFQTDRYNIISISNIINIISPPQLPVVSHELRPHHHHHHHHHLSLCLSSTSSLSSSLSLIVSVSMSLSLSLLVYISLSLTSLSENFDLHQEVKYIEIMCLYHSRYWEIFLSSAHGAKFSDTSAVFPEILTTRS